MAVVINGNGNITGLDGVFSADSVNTLVDTRIDSDSFVEHNEFNTLLDARIDSADFVTLTGDQTVAGTKTFSNNVGIGSSPLTKLYVSGTGDQTTSEVRAENTSATQNGRGVVRVKSSTSTYGAGIFATNNNETAYGNNVFGLYTFDDQPLVIGTNNTERMRIDSSGNVGIGATSPNTKLDVIGSSTNGSGVVDTLRLRNTGTSVGDGARIQFTAGTSTSGAAIASTGVSLNSADLRFYSGGNTERMRIDNTGNIEINGGAIYLNEGATGSSSIGIKNGSSTGTLQPSIAFFGEDNTTYPGHVHIVGRSDNASASAGDIVLWDYNGSSWNQNVTIKKTGYVGIGINDPSEYLEFTRTAGKIGWGMNGNYGVRIGYFDDGGGVHGFHVDTKHAGTTVSESRFVIRSNSGYVGIGTKSPSSMLHIGANGSTQRDALNIGTNYPSGTKTGKITWRDNANIVGQIDTSYDGTAVRMNIGSLYSSGYNSNDIMRIDPRHITTPSQPHAQAYLYGNQTISGGVWTQVNLNYTDSNIGGHFNTSNHRFTAPVTGVYLITYSVNFTSRSGTGGYLYTRVDVNGAVRKYTTGSRIVSQQYDTDKQMSGSLTILLNANDYVTLAGYSTQANSFNGSLNPHRTYCNFTLLG